MRHNKMPLARLEHRVILSSQKDIVVDGEFHLNRVGVKEMRASIEEKRKSTWMGSGQSFARSDAVREQQTHLIKTRYDPMLDITNYAWIYEQRHKSPARWFKVLELGQTEATGRSQFTCFSVRLMQSTDDAAAPSENTIANVSELELE